MSTSEQEFIRSPDPSGTFFRHLEELVHARAVDTRASHLHERSRVFRPLLLGYNGGGNVGSDIRVAELIRQFRVLFAHVDFEPVLTTLGSLSEPVFASVRQLRINRYFPDFLPSAAAGRNAVVVCEGSMFTSTFSDVLTGIFAAGIGYATVRRIPGIGYGATAGAMSKRLSGFVAKACRGGFILCRGKKSARILQGLGLTVAGGADPAWTFEPAGVDASCLLANAGWNGRDAVIAVCPVNPFWWPVQVDLDKARRVLRDESLKETHFRTVFFHSWSGARRKKYDGYLKALAKSIEAWQKQGYFPVLVGMEKLDRKSAADLNRNLRAPVPMFASGDFGMDAICAIVRKASLVVSSRFHATVLAMSGEVPAIGVSMDNRIDDLFSEHGLEEWVLRCDAPDLDERVLSLGTRLLGDVNDDARERCAKISASQIRSLGTMGNSLMDRLADQYPGFLPPCPLSRRWDSHLPPLSKRQERLLADHT